MEAEPGIEPRSTALQAAASFIDQQLIGYATRYATQLGMKILICRDRIVVRFDFLNIYATEPIVKVSVHSHPRPGLHGSGCFGYSRSTDRAPVGSHLSIAVVFTTLTDLQS